MNPWALAFVIVIGVHKLKIKRYEVGIKWVVINFKVIVGIFLNINGKMGTFNYGPTLIYI
jgi:hypothetical protein